MIKTKWLSEKDIQKKWYLIDVKDKILGRAATKIANILNGKEKVDYVPNLDCGDFVVVVNAKHVKTTGKKLLDKMYYRHSGRPGSLKEETLQEKLNKKPEDVIKLAVKNMLPKGPLGRKKLKKLKIFAETNHTHEAQKPEKIEI
jgi:large subunit ribosomal protein L13